MNGSAAVFRGFVVSALKFSVALIILIAINSVTCYHLRCHVNLIALAYTRLPDEGVRRKAIEVYFFLFYTMFRFATAA